MNDNPSPVWGHGVTEAPSAKDLSAGFREALLSRARTIETRPKSLIEAQKPWQLCKSLQDASSGGPYGFDTPERLQRCFSKSQGPSSAHTDRVLFFAYGATEQTWGATMKRRAPCPALPLEILGEMFLLATESTLGGDAHQTLINCMLVSKAWRHAALSTHRLWNVLRLRLDPFNIPKGLCGGVQTWFQRAGTLPKTFEFYSDGEANARDAMLEDAEQTKTPAIIALLLASIRIPVTSLALIDYTPASVQGILKALKGKASLARAFLQNLRIDFRVESPGMPWDPDSVLPFCDLPHVERLDLHLNQFPFQGEDPPMTEEYDWVDYLNPLAISPSVLRRLGTLRTGGNWHLEDVLSILKGCKQLETLILERLREDISLPVGGENSSLDDLRAEVPRLRKLYMHDLHATDNVTILFMSVKAPELEELHIAFCTDKNCTNKPSGYLSDSDSQSGEGDEMDVDEESTLTSLTDEQDDNNMDENDKDALTQSFLSAFSTFVRPCQDTLRTVKILNHSLRPASIARILVNVKSLTHLEVS